MGKFGRSAKFGQRPCSFQILIIGINHKITKQTVKILMRRLIRSRPIWMSTVCKCISEYTRCPKLPDLTLWFKTEQCSTVIYPFAPEFHLVLEYVVPQMLCQSCSYIIMFTKIKQIPLILVHLYELNSEKFLFLFSFDFDLFKSSLISRKSCQCQKLFWL